jgi:hypothetical protein
MEIEPVAGLTIIKLPSGKRAIVLVEIVGAKSAAKIAGALTDAAPPGRKPKP